MIDSRNAGQTCLQCRHYAEEAIRRDRFFGDLPITSYCRKFERTVHPLQGEDCSAFLRRPFVKSND